MQWRTCPSAQALDSQECSRWSRLWAAMSVLSRRSTCFPTFDTDHWTADSGFPRTLAETPAILCSSFLVVSPGEAVPRFHWSALTTSALCLAIARAERRSFLRRSPNGPPKWEHAVSILFMVVNGNQTPQNVCDSDESLVLSGVFVPFAKPREQPTLALDLERSAKMYLILILIEDCVR